MGGSEFSPFDKSPDEVTAEANADHQRTIEAEVWSALQEGIDGGWVTQAEAEDRFMTWHQTYTLPRPRHQNRNRNK